MLYPTSFPVIDAQTVNTYQKVTVGFCLLSGSGGLTYTMRIGVI